MLNIRFTLLGSDNFYQFGLRLLLEVVSARPEQQQP